MFCPNCGRKWNEGETFCGGCGNKRNQNIVQTPQFEVISESPVESVIPPKKGMSGWGIAVIIILSVVFLASVGFLFLVIVAIVTDTTEYTTDETVEFVYVDGDSVPSLYHLMGYYELCYSPYTDYYDDYETITYEYCDYYIDEEVMDEYLDYLIDDYGFENYTANNSRAVIKDSEEEGYSIIVDVSYDGYYIEYKKVDMDTYEPEDNTL